MISWDTRSHSVSRHWMAPYQVTKFGLFCSGSESTSLRQLNIAMENGPSIDDLPNCLWLVIFRSYIELPEGYRQISRLWSVIYSGLFRSIHEWHDVLHVLHVILLPSVHAKTTQVLELAQVIDLPPGRWFTSELLRSKGSEPLGRSNLYLKKRTSTSLRYTIWSNSIGNPLGTPFG